MFEKIARPKSCSFVLLTAIISASIACMLLSLISLLEVRKISRNAELTIAHIDKLVDLDQERLSALQARNVTINGAADTQDISPKKSHLDGAVNHIPNAAARP